MADINQRTAAMHFDALLTPAQVRDYETQDAPYWSVARRATMYLLTSDKPALLKSFGSSDAIDSLFALAEHIEQWKQHLSDQTEMATAAIARLIVIGSVALQPEFTAPSADQAA